MQLIYTESTREDQLFFTVALLINKQILNTEPFQKVCENADIWY